MYGIPEKRSRDRDRGDATVPPNFYDMNLLQRTNCARIEVWFGLVEWFSGSVVQWLSGWFGWVEVWLSG